jgi:hypothetical protein
MSHRILFLVLCASLASSPALAQDDLLEKIKRLEQQIQELKVLKEQQNISAAKAEQCMKVVAREKFCTCVGNSLPLDISFEDYVHTLITSNEALGYAGMTRDQKTVIDATRGVRDTCIEKGFFK